MFDSRTEKCEWYKQHCKERQTRVALADDIEAVECKQYEPERDRQQTKSPAQDSCKSADDPEPLLPEHTEEPEQQKCSRQEMQSTQGIVCTAVAHERIEHERIHERRDKCDRPPQHAARQSRKQSQHDPGNEEHYRKQEHQQCLGRMLKRHRIGDFPLLLRMCQLSVPADVSGYNHRLYAL